VRDGRPAGGAPVVEAGLLARCRFPPAGTPLVCAVSGGADSLALLALAVAAGCRATAAHVDHGLRAGSAAEADVVEAAARRLGAGFAAHRVAVAPGANLEARARDARRAVLPPGTATGHTADDQAETIIVNLLRGAGLDGLAGMRPGPAKPILALRRHETRALCGQLGLVPLDDPTNRDPAFVRNRVRHEVIPLLDEVAGAPIPLARRAVRRWLAAGVDHPPAAADVERVLVVAAGEAVACEIAGGRRVRRTAGRLVLDP